MKIRNFFGVSASIAVVMFLAACGGSSGSSGTSSDTTGTGEASLKSLATVPSVDLSQYDSSSTTSSNVAVPPSVSAGKTLGAGMRDAGESSRAGCESNMHKQEIFRMSQQVQLDKCYPKAMEKVGFITIPTGSYAYYKIKPPAVDSSELAKKCAGIPAERADELAKCLAGSEGPGSGVMLMRIGNIGDQLQIDMCQGAEGAEALVNEATYTASGSLYTADIKRIGMWNGMQEKNAFNVSLDLGTTGKVTDEVPTLGSDSALTATAQMSGGYGSGNIGFEYVGADASNRIKGSFSGSFTDPSTLTSSSFIGRTYARFGGSTRTGCGKYAFTGSMPGMKVSNMIPFNITDSNRAQFLATLSAQLGIDINENNYRVVVLCTNPNFNPDRFDPTIKPMILGSAGGTCPAVTHTGVECFSISNATRTGSYGEVIYTPLFTIIATSGSPYYAEVNAFDVTSLSSMIGTIAHARNWDCSGTFTTLDFATMTESQRATAETAMQACKAIEEEARGNSGMGGHDCGEKDQATTVKSVVLEGGGDASVGAYGGKWYLNNGCESFPYPAASNLFVSVVNANDRTYCLGVQGTCLQFSVNGSNAVTTSMNYGDGLYITNMQYNGAAPTAVDVSWSKNGQNCTANYLRTSGEFTPPAQGTEGMPTACKNAGLTTPDQCQQLCMQENNPCGFVK